MSMIYAVDITILVIYVTSFSRAQCVPRSQKFECYVKPRAN